MKELLRTNDITLIAFTKHVLSEVDIAVFELDVNMSVLEGSIGILPQRLMVIDEEYEIAFDTMIENGIEAQVLTGRNTERLMMFGQARSRSRSQNQAIARELIQSFLRPASLRNPAKRFWNWVVVWEPHHLRLLIA